MPGAIYTGKVETNLQAIVTGQSRCPANLVSCLSRQNFRQALFRLRRVLGQDVRLTDGEEASLAPGAISCDVTQLEMLVGQSTRTH